MGVYVETKYEYVGNLKAGDRLQRGIFKEFVWDTTTRSPKTEQVVDILYADVKLHSFYSDNVLTIDGYYRNIRLDRVVVFPKRTEDYGIENILRGINAWTELKK